MRSEKLASIGRLAAGIAHEINNPLTSVLTFSSLLLRKPENEDQKEKLEIIVKETTRCREIVRDLLNFARQGEPKKEECSINQIIESALSLTKNQVKVSENRIAVQKELGELPLLQLDPNQMLEVFVNIIINAIDAMPQGGELKMTTCAGPDGKVGRDQGLRYGIRHIEGKPREEYSTRSSPPRTREKARAWGFP